MAWGQAGPARLSPRADAIPPVGWEPRARLGCQDREARASEGHSPRALGMTSLSGAGTAHRAMCARVKAPFHPAGDDGGAEAGLRKELWGLGHAGHTLYTWPACVLPPCPRIYVGLHVGRRSPSAGQEGAEGDPRAHTGLSE